MQDEIHGGISDRADDECDVYHTFFGIAGLSLLGFPHLEHINPVYALPVSIVDELVGGKVSSTAEMIERC